MRLSTFSDYSLRVLMYLAERPGRLATIAQIAEAHAISENHLMKVVHQLGRAGYLDTVRGKGGGMQLARPPEDIVLGAVLRETETDFALVECLGGASCCRIQPGCRLKSVLGEALGALFVVLDRYTLADLLRGGEDAAEALAATALPRG